MQSANYITGAPQEPHTSDTIDDEFDEVVKVNMSPSGGIEPFLWWWEMKRGGRRVRVRGKLAYSRLYIIFEYSNH